MIPFRCACLNIQLCQIISVFSCHSQETQPASATLVEATVPFIAATSVLCMMRKDFFNMDILIHCSNVAPAQSPQTPAETKSSCIDVMTKTKQNLVVYLNCSRWKKNSRAEEAADGSFWLDNKVGLLSSVKELMLLHLFTLRLFHDLLC